MGDGVHNSLGGFSGHRSNYRDTFGRPNYSNRPKSQSQPKLVSEISNTQNITQNVLYENNNVANKSIEQIQTQNIVSTTPEIQYVEPQIETQVNIQEIKSTKTIRSHKGRSKLQYALLTFAIILVVGGLYESFVGWHTNQVAQAAAAKLTQQANSNSSGSNSTALSTVKPSAAAIANYAVAPNLPRYLIIPKLNVNARVFSVGVNSSGALNTPNNVYDTAWYNESAQPGQPGATLIDGHVSSWTTRGVFYGIKTLIPGDQIKVVRGDGTIFTYSVVKSQVFASGNVDMNSAITPVVPGQSGLNLITCTGDVIPGTSEFNQRVIVYATLIN